MDPNGGRAYEDFVPPHNMVREPPTYTLTVDLSGAGYKKEHIKVQTVHSHRRLIVRGERPVAGNRWSRFRLVFRVPDDCDLKGIEARFENGVVRVVMTGLKAEPADAGVQEPAAKTDAAGVQDRKDDAARRDSDRAQGGGDKKDEQRAAAAKDVGRREGPGGVGGEEADASPSRRGYGFLPDRRKLATTVLGVVLVLVSLGIYVKYSLWP